MPKTAPAPETTAEDPLYPFWTDAQLEECRRRAIEIYVESWGPHLQERFFELVKEGQEKVRALFEESDNLRLLTGDPDFLRRRERRKFIEPALFLTVPRLSKANFKTLAAASGEVEVLLRFLNLLRVPWMRPDWPRGEEPTEEQVEAAIESAAEQWARQKFDTWQRKERARLQEETVRNQLETTGLTYVEPAAIAERVRKVKGNKCDVPAHLEDGTLLALECKVSNEATNSVKRLIRETRGKLGDWNDAFGSRIRTGAALSGVFKLNNLKQAQQRGMLLFFDQELETLDAFIKAGGEPRPR